LLLLRHARAHRSRAAASILGARCRTRFSSRQTRSNAELASVRRPAWAIVCFESGRLVRGPDQCMRHDRLTPLGYVDDGWSLRRRMHSVRVPIPDTHAACCWDDIAVLHYLALRPTALEAKRAGKGIENVRGTCPGCSMRASAMPCTSTSQERWEQRSLVEWFRELENAGIDNAAPSLRSSTNWTIFRGAPALQRVRARNSG